MTTLMTNSPMEVEKENENHRIGLDEDCLVHARNTNENICDALLSVQCENIVHLNNQ
jgi:hypothetical protein